MTSGFHSVSPTHPPGLQGSDYRRQVLNLLVLPAVRDLLSTVCRENRLTDLTPTFHIKYYCYPGLDRSSGQDSQVTAPHFRITVESQSETFLNTIASYPQNGGSTFTTLAPRSVLHPSGNTIRTRFTPGTRTATSSRSERAGVTVEVSLRPDHWYLIFRRHGGTSRETVEAHAILYFRLDETPLPLYQASQGEYPPNY